MLVRFADHVKQCLPISAYSNKKNRTTLFLLVRFADHVKQCLPISAYSNKKNRTTLFLLVRFADHVKQCLPISAYSNKKNRTTLFLLVRFADHVKQFRLTTAFDPGNCFRICWLFQWSLAFVEYWDGQNRFVFTFGSICSVNVRFGLLPHLTRQILFWFFSLI